MHTGMVWKHKKGVNESLLGIFVLFLAIIILVELLHLTNPTGGVTLKTSIVRTPPIQPAPTVADYISAQPEHGFQLLVSYVVLSHLMHQSR